MCQYVLYKTFVGVNIGPMSQPLKIYLLWVLPSVSIFSISLFRILWWLQWRWIWEWWWRLWWNGSRLSRISRFQRNGLKSKTQKWIKIQENDQEMDVMLKLNKPWHSTVCCWNINNPSRLTLLNQQFILLMCYRGLFFHFKMQKN